MSANASRLQAIQNIFNRKPIAVAKPDPQGSIWTEGVFNLARMEWALSKTAFKAMKKTV
jgi:glutamine synthetase